MLSRAAAVKAPRTDYRRRVTGSSGRRREGRESEPQRPNMSRRVFNFGVLLLLFVLMCCDVGAAYAGEGNLRDTVDALLGIKWDKLDNWEEVNGDGREITSLRVPGLVKVGDDVFAVAEAQCGERNGAGICAGIVSKHLDIKGDPMDISMLDISLSCMQLVGTADNNFGTTEVLRPTTLVLGDSVYMLLGNYSRTKPPVEGTNERGLLLVKGTVSGEGGKKKIRWNDTHLVKPQGRGKSGSLTGLIGGGGSGVVMRDGTLVFPMQAKDSNGTSVLLSMRFDPSDKKWWLPQITPGKGCRDPTLVKWEEDEYGERLFMMAHCDGGYYDVHKSILDGGNWNGHVKPITRVWGNSHNRSGHGVQSGFTTAIIEEKKVMLITAPVYAKDNEKGRLHLWVTDKARVYDVGPVSRKEDDAAASSLLIKDNNSELISLYENKKSDGAYNLVAVSLTEKLERIKEVVKTWKDLDSALKTCRSGSSGTVDARKKRMCKGRVPTDGLVGFLSGNFSDNTWKDEYLGVNATVTNGEKRVLNGWTFKGSGAGAVWPVGDMGQTVPYYFANNKFTLVATVSIHEVPQSDRSPVPLIGVRMNDTKGTVLFGLSYTHDKTWLAIAEDAGDPEDAGDLEDFDEAEDFDIVKWETNKTYQVVLKMNYDKWTVVVDKDEIHNMRYDENLFNSRRISHFYIGGDSKYQSATGGHVTVTNVMLYNEELFGNDLRKLHASKVTIPSLGAEEQSTEQVSSTDDSVASESWSEESVSYEEFTEDDTDEEEEESADVVVPAPSSSKVDAGSSVPESATAAESAGASHQEDNTQLSEGETFQQSTPNEDNGSMQRDSGVQTQDPQPEELTEVADVKGPSESNDTPQPEEEEEANDMSDGTTSPLTASLSMETVTAPADGEHQLQQKVELSNENNDVRSTGTGNTGAEQSLSLEAGDGNSERTMGSDSSLTPSESDAETTSAGNTDDVFRTKGAEVSSENGNEVPQTVETAPGNTNTTPGETAIPSESNATTPSDTEILLENGHYSELAGMYLIAESTVHVCVSRVLLLLLGLWGTAALC
ncbi:putative trans-sialidase, Group VIII [Trypanosoma cruzi]|uniref:Trans-sialidase, putative n=2 Tax=Trypanosoma cruzi TaxID=5693 RepID=Q4DMZ9_TRYCC|nr:trans-sialidase, putative [Trypanosoma cruzi]EAN93898.1 trans-sialidase, putative [Trypanosoma cruzi]PWU97670.1 putative trans-sialidase, Group VIII [Trypanosoma cruzi]RNC44321.1 sialidase-like protein [Trypanosoma cruzi]|eukprot:XP_815749.1 trans-sialidase [Trypanosoma cruzi strain CL Brener]